MTDHPIFSAREVEQHIAEWKKLAAFNGEAWLKATAEVRELKAKLAAVTEDLSSWRTRADLAERVMATATPVLEAARSVRDCLWPWYLDVTTGKRYRAWIGYANINKAQLIDILSPLAKTLHNLEDPQR